MRAVINGLIILSVEKDFLLLILLQETQRILRLNPFCSGISQFQQGCWMGQFSLIFPSLNLIFPNPKEAPVCSMWCLLSKGQGVRRGYIELIMAPRTAFFWLNLNNYHFHLVFNPLVCLNTDSYSSCQLEFPLEISSQMPEDQQSCSTHNLSLSDPLSEDGRRRLRFENARGSSLKISLNPMHLEALLRNVAKLFTKMSGKNKRVDAVGNH